MSHRGTPTETNRSGIVRSGGTEQSLCGGGGRETDEKADSVPLPYDKAIDGIGIEDREVSKTKPQSSIRKGNYKLIYFYDSNKVELYDLREDIQESNDLSQSRPGDAAELESELFNYLNKVNARFPRRNIVCCQQIP